MKRRMKFELFSRRLGQSDVPYGPCTRIRTVWHWRLRAGNGRIIGHCPLRGYRRRVDALETILSICYEGLDRKRTRILEIQKNGKKRWL